MKRTIAGKIKSTLIYLNKVYLQNFTKFIDLLGWVGVPYFDETFIRKDTQGNTDKAKFKPKGNGAAR